MDIETISRLFQGHYSIVVATARKYAPTPDSVFDVVHQVFINFVEGIRKHQWEVEQDFSATLTRMTRNAAVDHWRQNRSHLSEKVREVAEHLMKQNREADLLGNPSEEIETLRQCVEQLPPRGRDLIRRHYMDGVSMTELSEKESINPGTLRKNFFRLRQFLRECMQAKNP